MAPILSGKERAKRFREKHKEEVKQKNKMRMRLKREEERKVRSQCKKACEEYKEKERKRKQLYREKIKASSIGNPSTSSDLRKAYSSPQTLGKAVSKTVKSLPKSPTKKLAVVSHLVSKVGMKLLQTEETKSASKENILHNKVKDFYYRPDIVYTAPGIKDEITIWKNGKKLKLRKFYLTMFLKEAYAVFCDEFPEHNISFSTFCRLRPENVLLLNQTPLDQCKCMICENFFLDLKSLKIAYDSKSFWKDVLCNDEINSECWQGICSTCLKGQKIITTDDIGRALTWKQWIKDFDKKLTCSVKETCIGEVKSSLEESFSTVVSHINVKRIQAMDFEKDKSSPETRVLQVDFAMNYSCSYQDEVQSALWSRKSITLFTAAIFHKNTCKTMLICSDTTEKEKNTVRNFISAIYDELDPSSQNNKNITEIIWTDGPSSEFKNKYMVAFLQELTSKYNKNFHWKYFATSHGKGVVDGVGGKAKSTVQTIISSKKINAPIVQTAEDFAKIIKEHMKSTKVMVILEDKISRTYAWDHAQPIPGISKMHIIKSSPEKVEFYANALSPATVSSENPRNLVQTNDIDISVGNWVVILYDETEYPGEVLQIKDDEVEVSVMERHGNHWKWPRQEDKLFYSIENVVKIIKPPIVTNSRNYFKFPDFE